MVALHRTQELWRPSRRPPPDSWPSRAAKGR